MDEVRVEGDRRGECGKGLLSLSLGQERPSELIISPGELRMLMNSRGEFDDGCGVIFPGHRRHPATIMSRGVAQRDCAHYGEDDDHRSSNTAL